MMMKERHSYIIRTALMAASGILLCGIAEAVRPEVDLSVGVPADKVVIADGILDQETQNNTDESFCDRLMKKMVHPIHMASRFLNGLGADSEEYVPSETEYNLMALRTEESAVDLSDPLAAFESLPWYKLAKRFRSMGTEDTWGAKMYEALGTRDAQWISEIYGWIQTTPLTASQKMGLPAAQVLGSYDPSNPEHNAQDPASWVVPTWKNIRFQICDGDGKPTSLASNATDILSMANVYTYSLDWKNTDLFNTYINQLWTSSHQYHVSISNVYYCEGCTELPDEPATEGTADDNVESGSAAGEADRITDLRLFGGDALDLVDIFAYGAHPVCFIRLGHVAQLLAVHGGRGEPDLLFKGGKAVVCGKSHHSTSLSCFAGGSFVCAAAKFCAVPVLSHHRIRPPQPERGPLPCRPGRR